MSKLKVFLFTLTLCNLFIFSSLWAEYQDASQRNTKSSHQKQAPEPNQISFKEDVLDKMTLAHQAYDKNDCPTVIQLSDESLDLIKKHRMEDLSHEEANAHYHLGACYKKLGDYQKAKSYLKKAIKLYDKISEAYGKLVSMGSLASLERALGNYQVAYQLYNENIAIRKKLYGSESKFLPGILNNYGQIFLDAKKWDRASQVYGEAARILQSQQALASQLPLVIRFNQFWVALGKSDMQVAESLLQDLVKQFEVAVSQENPLFYEFADGRALFYFKKGDFAQAEFYANQALQLRGISPQSDLVSRFMLNLGKIYHAQEKYDEAIAMYDQAYQAFSKKYKVRSSHPLLGEIMVARAEARLAKAPKDKKAKKELEKGKKLIAKAFSFLED